MKKILFFIGEILYPTLIVLSIFAFMNVAYAKTLVKYNKNTGDIIQTNTVDKMPSADILADRFKTTTTDVLLVDEPVDISKQRVDLNTKGIIDIPKKELDDRAKEIKDKQDKKNADKQKAIDKLKALGFTDDEIKALFE